jgi:hypothetical protein
MRHDVSPWLIHTTVRPSIASRIPRGWRISSDVRPNSRLRGGAHVAAEHVHHPLHAVADAEHRHAEVEQLARHVGASVAYTDAGPAGKDDSGEVHRARALERARRRRDLRPSRWPRARGAR